MRWDLRCDERLTFSTTSSTKHCGKRTKVGCGQPACGAVAHVIKAGESATSAVGQRDRFVRGIVSRTAGATPAAHRKVCVRPPKKCEQSGGISICALACA